MANRIYSVYSRESGQTRLVRADNQSQAIRAVASELYRCEVADQETIFELASKGVKIIDARQPQIEMSGGGALNE